MDGRVVRGYKHGPSVQGGGMELGEKVRQGKVGEVLSDYGTSPSATTTKGN